MDGKKIYKVANKAYLERDDDIDNHDGNIHVFIGSGYNEIYIGGLDAIRSNLLEQIKIFQSAFTIIKRRFQ